jgi:hypothetical protein
MQLFVLVIMRILAGRRMMSSDSRALCPRAGPGGPDYVALSIIILISTHMEVPGTISL